MKGTGQSPRFRNSPENRLGPPKPKKAKAESPQQQEQQGGILEQLADEFGPPRKEEPKGSTGSGDADFGIPTRPVPTLRGW
jgi:hypothetical protein